MLKPRITLERRKSLYGYVFILPWIIGFLLFFITPVIKTIQFSFNTVVLNPTGYKLDWVGFKNYVDAFRTDANFPQKLASSLTSLATNVPVVLVFSFFAALLLKEKFRGNALAKMVFFLPVILASGFFLSVQSKYGDTSAQNINAAIEESKEMIQILDVSNIQGLLMRMGIPANIIGYIIAPVNAIFNVISTSGIQIFVFLAGLNSISPSLYEAAYIEGATGWETFWKVTFPMISPLILVNTLYSIIDNFTSINNATMEYIKSLMFSPNFRFGPASAMAWIYFLILAVILGIVGFFISKRVFYHT